MRVDYEDSLRIPRTVQIDFDTDEGRFLADMIRDCADYQRQRSTEDPAASIAPPSMQAIFASRLKRKV